MDLLSDLEHFLHAESSLDPLVRAFLVHYQFEAIHPFSDGNGRVGRLLLTILITEWCAMPAQWLYLSPFFDANKDEYIDRLLHVSTRGEWRGWVEFCLRGTIEQAKDTEKRCEQLLEAHREMLQITAALKGSYRLHSIVEGLFQWPVVTVSHIANQHGVAYNTAKADVDRLVKAGVLKDLEGMYPKSFFSPQVVRITYDDS
jgi:Fic family protein